MAGNQIRGRIAGGFQLAVSTFQRNCGLAFYRRMKSDGLARRHPLECGDSHVRVKNRPDH
jgi:hypothetical protein